MAQIIVLFALLLVIANVVARLNDFKTYIKQHFPKLKENSAEYKERLAIFQKNIQLIHEHNNKQDNKYKLTVNQFTGMTTKEKRAVLGKRMDMDQAHEPKHVIEEHGFEMKPVNELPDSIDWRNKQLASAVKDQGGCGSCYAFAAAAMLEAYLAQSSGLMFNLSPQMGASCAPNPQSCGGSGGCEGGTAEIIFDHLANGGKMAQEYQYGYTGYYGEDSECKDSDVTNKLTIQGYTLLTSNNYTELMNAVAQVGPVSIGVDASEWHNYDSGVFNGCDQKNPDVNHAVVLYGYGIDDISGDKYWLVRNSWSPTYGESGYIRIYRDDNESDNCGIQLNPQDNDACEGDFKPRRVCGTCGILSGSSYLRGVQLAE